MTDTDDKKPKYPYELADGLIHEIYKKEFSDGGFEIEMVDAGELHFLLGKFWEKISPKVEKLQDALGLYLNTLIKIQYTNWRGENSLRSVIPRKILFGSTEWHPSKQWLLYAHDVDKNDMRSFAIQDIEAFFIEPKRS